MGRQNCAELRQNCARTAPAQIARAPLDHNLVHLARRLALLEEGGLPAAHEDLVQPELVVVGDQTHRQRDRLDELRRLERLHEVGHRALVPLVDRRVRDATRVPLLHELDRLERARALELRQHERAVEF